MTTLADVLADTRTHLLASSREQYNTLAVGPLAGDTTLTFTYALDGITKGAYVAVELEVMYVFDVDPGGKTATVGRGWQGTTAAAHNTGAVVTVKPKFPDGVLLRRVNEELRSLSAPTSGLYRVLTTSFAYNSAILGYSLPAATYGVLEVRRDTSGSGNEYPQVRSWEVLRGMPVGDYPNLIGLRLNDYAEPGLNIIVTYKTAFTSLASLTDDVLAVSGLPESAHDILGVGAAVRAMAGREIPRNFTGAQSDTRRGEEVPPGAVSASSRDLRALRQQRIVEEAARLAGQWPTGGF